MPGIKPLEEMERRWVEKSLLAFVNGEQNLHWIMGVIQRSGIRGEVLLRELDQVRGHGDQQRSDAALQACQERGWLS